MNTAATPAVWDLAVETRPDSADTAREAIRTFIEGDHE